MYKGFFVYILRIDAMLLAFFGIDIALNPYSFNGYDELKFTYFVFISSFIILLKIFSIVKNWSYESIKFEEAKLSKKIASQRVENQLLQNELIRVKIEIAKKRLATCALEK